jgi:hypothetical protein
MADKRIPGGIDWNDPVAMERRIFYLMCAINLVAVMLSAAYMPWRITAGLALGGVLAWLNHRWLRSSIAAAFRAVATGAKPNLSVTRYFLRYLVMAAVVTAGYWWDVISVPATLAALGSFAAAAMLEAFIQTVFIVVRKEGN